jgi:hypothetical protein
MKEMLLKTMVKLNGNVNSCTINLLELHASIRH